MHYYVMDYVTTSTQATGQISIQHCIIQANAQSGTLDTDSRAFYDMNVQFITHSRPLSIAVELANNSFTSGPAWVLPHLCHRGTALA